MLLPTLGMSAPPEDHAWCCRKAITLHLFWWHGMFYFCDLLRLYTLTSHSLMVFLNNQDVSFLSFKRSLLTAVTLSFGLHYTRNLCETELICVVCVCLFELTFIAWSMMKRQCVDSILENILYHYYFNETFK